MLSHAAASSILRPRALYRAIRSLSAGSAVPVWASLDPNTLGTVETHNVCNIVGGSWQHEGDVAKRMTIPNPMRKSGMAVCTIPDTSVEELGPFVRSLESVPKSGMHNPLKNLDRYLLYGEISRKVRTNPPASHYQYKS